MFHFSTSSINRSTYITLWSISYSKFMKRIRKSKSKSNDKKKWSHYL